MSGPYFMSIFVILDILNYMMTNESARFRNELLDLDTDKTYSLDDIKRLYIDIYKYFVTENDLSETSIDNVQKHITLVRGHLLKKVPHYYSGSLIMDIILRRVFSIKYDCKNKDKLEVILSNITEEIENEKEFFGLAAREKDVFKSLRCSKSLSDGDKKNIDELKETVAGRYQELLKNTEKEKEARKKSNMLTIVFGIVGTYLSYLSLY